MLEIVKIDFHTILTLKIPQTHQLLENLIFFTLDKRVETYEKEWILCVNQICL